MAPSNPIPEQQKRGALHSNDGNHPTKRTKLNTNPTLLQMNHGRLPHEIVSQIIGHIVGDGLVESKDPAFQEQRLNLANLVRTNLALAQETSRQVYSKPLHLMVTDAQECNYVTKEEAEAVPLQEEEVVVSRFADFWIARPFFSNDEIPKLDKWGKLVIHLSIGLSNPGLREGEVLGDDPTLQHFENAIDRISTHSLALSYQLREYVFGLVARTSGNDCRGLVVRRPLNIHLAYEVQENVRLLDESRPIPLWDLDSFEETFDRYSWDWLRTSMAPAEFSLSRITFPPRMAACVPVLCPLIQPLFEFNGSWLHGAFPKHPSLIALSLQESVGRLVTTRGWDWWPIERRIDDSIGITNLTAVPSDVLAHAKSGSSKDDNKTFNELAVLSIDTRQKKWTAEFVSFRDAEPVAIEVSAIPLDTSVDPPTTDVVA